MEKKEKVLITELEVKKRPLVNKPVYRFQGGKVPDLLIGDSQFELRIANGIYGCSSEFNFGFTLQTLNQLVDYAGTTGDWNNGEPYLDIPLKSGDSPYFRFIPDNALSTDDLPVLQAQPLGKVVGGTALEYYVESDVPFLPIYIGGTSEGVVNAGFPEKHIYSLIDGVLTEGGNPYFAPKSPVDWSYSQRLMNLRRLDGSTLNYVANSVLSYTVSDLLLYLDRSKLVPAGFHPLVPKSWVSGMSLTSKWYVGVIKFYI